MLKLDPRSPVPLVEQIRRGIRRAIAEGELVLGDDLPPVRQLAGDLGINLNTVARAYRELERDGLVTSARGRGTVVAANRDTVRLAKGALRDRVRNLLADATLAGYRGAEVEKILVSEIKRRMG